ncbi:hypothetical protein Bpfe_012718 [Biomphalaria pfeifferi]|uniref:Uncharacterized protein n=1 Tax=Biomphalaria pfeifferi TaxID=112525 RepID=A0AAD8BN65_BIOPF|nr:hypothetical protein Bpfe_012718 [Biomphalaria pfeifferi]
MTSRYGVETIEDYFCSQRSKGCRVNYKERSCIEEEFVGCENYFHTKLREKVSEIFVVMATLVNIVNHAEITALVHHYLQSCSNILL